MLENELDPDKRIHHEMTQIMLQSNGIGLAAPQVGILKEIFYLGNEGKY